MKKSLLSLSLMLGALNLSAFNDIQEPLSVLPVQNAISASDNEIITNPEGTDALYVMNCGIITNWGMFEYPSLKSEICFDADGKTVYFHNLFPRYKECWVKGTIDGNDIVIPSGQAIYEDVTYGVVYFYASKDGGNGVYNTVDDMRLTMSEDEWGQKHIVSADTLVLGGVVKDDKDGMGYLVLNGYYQMDEFLDAICEVPADLKREEYVFSYKDYYWKTFSENVELAFDGNEVYLHGLIPDANPSSGWVKGTIEGDSLCIPSRQGAYSSIYLLSFFAGYAAKYDEYGDPMFASKDTLKLAISEDKTFTSVAGDYALTVYGNHQNLIYAFESLQFTPYAGDVPAVPSAAKFNVVNDYNVEFDIKCEDVDGNYINPKNLSYSFFVDDELFTFTPQEYIYIGEEMTEIPWSYTDNYDFIAYGDTHMFYIYDLLYSTIGIQVYYTVDGVRNASEMTYWQNGGDGLVQVEKGQKINHTEYFDLTGRRILKPQGTYIRKSFMSDGTVKSDVLVK